MKKRYQVSLDEENVIEFQKVAAVLGFDKKVMSVICNDAIKKTASVFRKASEKGGLNMIDLFDMIGEEMESIEDYERMEHEKKSSQKTAGVEKKSKR